MRVCSIWLKWGEDRADCRASDAMIRWSLLADVDGSCTGENSSTFIIIYIA